MDEVLLTASRLALLVTGVGGAAAVLASAVHRRVGLGWIPALAAVAVLLMFPFADPVDGSPWLITLTLLPWFVGFPLLAATFPDGRFVPRWSFWAVVVSALALVVNVATGDAWRQSGWWALFAATQLGVIGFIVFRYRRSATTSERESVRWVLLGLIVTVALFMTILIVDGAIGEGDSLSVAKANAAGIPLMLGLVVGLAWPRVWNVDAAFRAVLVVLFAGFALVGVYAAARAIAAATTSREVAAGWGTVAVAAFAYPVTRLAIRVATWLVFRDRADADTTVTRLADALDADDPRSAAQRVVDAASAAIASPSVTMLAASGTDASVFEARTPAGSTPLVAPVESFPVTFRGELLATVTVSPRLGESELSARDRAVMTAIAQHAAPALHGARALREATDAQAALVSAREEERRRLRRELHDDLGPALSGLALGAAALAKRADGVDPAIAESARELQVDIGDVVARSREISHGLRPPVLDDRGLEAAIRARLGPTPDVLLHIDDIGELPAAVDLAALRIVQEAVTNARRHARASVCSVRVAREARCLRIEVADDGVGMPRVVTAGMGLRSIRERANELGGRARVSRPRSGGTLVSVWLPVEARTEETG